MTINITSRIGQHKNKTHWPFCIKQNAKCYYAIWTAKWTCKIVDFPRNCEMEMVATCFTTDGNGIITNWRHNFSKRRHDADVKNIAGDDQATLIVHRNSANIASTFRFYVCLRLRYRDGCAAADSNGSSHAPAPSYFEEMTYCRHQKLHWRWPGNPNGRSKFHNLRLFTFTRSQLTHQRRLHG